MLKKLFRSYASIIAILTSIAMTTNELAAALQADNISKAFLHRVTNCKYVYDVESGTAPAEHNRYALVAKTEMAYGCMGAKTVQLTI